MVSVSQDDLLQSYINNQTTLGYKFMSLIDVHKSLFSFYVWDVIRFCSGVLAVRHPEQ